MKLLRNERGWKTWALAQVGTIESSKAPPDFPCYATTEADDGGSVFAVYLSPLELLAMLVELYNAQQRDIRAARDAEGTRGDSVQH